MRTLCLKSVSRDHAAAAGTNMLRCSKKSRTLMLLMCCILPARLFSSVDLPAERHEAHVNASTQAHAVSDMIT